MKSIVDWFWKYRPERPVERSFSNKDVYEIRKIVKKDEAFKSARVKPSVAFWGPSQSGKSSLLSHYIDAEDNLALSWSDDLPVRFSGDENINEEAVIFNPYNAGNDGSGLVTRFYLPSEKEKEEINNKVPVEAVLSNRKQILNAIAFGYRLECNPSENPWTRDGINKLIEDKSKCPDKEALELLSDFLDVCTNLSKEYGRFDELGKGEFKKQVLASSCADNLEEAKTLVKYVLWDNMPGLEKLYENILKVLKEFKSAQKIFVSMEAAALLEDISLVSFYEKYNSVDSSSQYFRKINAINNLQVAKKGSIVYLYCGDLQKPEAEYKSSNYDFTNFGYLQAAICELRIPLKKRASEDHGNSNELFSFLEKCDLIDIPGITNQAVGEAQDKEKLIDPNNFDKNEYLTRLYKSGKTFSIIYDQTEGTPIYSFVVFIDLQREGGISRPATLNSGIKAWLETWPGRAEFKPRLFVNCSLFGKMLDVAKATAEGGGLVKYCEKLTGDKGINFIDKADIVFTSNRFKPCKKKNLKEIFQNDRHFSDLFLKGNSQKSFDALFDDGFGTDYLFQYLLTEIKESQASELKKLLILENTENLKTKISHILPKPSDEIVEKQKKAINSILKTIEEKNCQNNVSEAKKLGDIVKYIFYVDPDIVEDLPNLFQTISDQVIIDYIQKQLDLWIADRKDSLSGEIIGFMTSDEFELLLNALTDINCDEIKELIKRNFANPNLKQIDSKEVLARLINNYLLYGQLGRSSLTGSFYDVFCVPFIKRMKSLLNELSNSRDIFKRDLPGDNEFSEILKSLNLL